MPGQRRVSELSSGSRRTDSSLGAERDTVAHQAPACGMSASGRIFGCTVRALGLREKLERPLLSSDQTRSNRVLLEAAHLFSLGVGR
ncbi:Serine/threonine-protein kinase Nek7 [Anopheles sinensis]|uniref:Serine/threonine-protein kinase Nek7 n=1 Tax=Anopheles sinensis TaxID=74873 RepID=A0A084VUY5_ANOSI|nr:Serine/threonine-protein kinase Nek7 [Anopheles sinensis]